MNKEIPVSVLMELHLYMVYVVVGGGGWEGIDNVKYTNIQNILYVMISFLKKNNAE